MTLFLYSEKPGRLGLADWLLVNMMAETAMQMQTRVLAQRIASITYSWQQPSGRSDPHADNYLLLSRMQMSASGSRPPLARATVARGTCSSS